MKKPREKIASCETCLYSQGEAYQDPADKDITRIYCKARHTIVDMPMMTKYCDFWKIDPEK